jgi:hypothetical protein
MLRLASLLYKDKACPWGRVKRIFARDYSTAKDAEIAKMCIENYRFFFAPFACLAVISPDRIQDVLS